MKKGAHNHRRRQQISTFRILSELKETRGGGHNHHRLQQNGNSKGCVLAADPLLSGRESVGEVLESMLSGTCKRVVRVCKLHRAEFYLVGWSLFIVAAHSVFSFN